MSMKRSGSRHNRNRILRQQVGGLLSSPLTHSSVIPLKGGENATSGKRPALRWNPYTRRQPTPDELHTWFVKTAHAVYGMMCGAVSGLVVLDTINGSMR